MVVAEWNHFGGRKSVNAFKVGIKEIPLKIQIVGKLLPDEKSRFGAVAAPGVFPVGFRTEVTGLDIDRFTDQSGIDPLFGDPVKFRIA